MSNIFSCVARLTGDSESRVTPNEQKVLQFGIANNQGYGDRQKTLFIRCSLWGARGEKLQQYLTKGTQIFISGELSENEYTDRNSGETRKTLELNVNQVDLVGSKPQGQQQAQTSQPATTQARPDLSVAAEDLDDIPF